MPTLEWIGKKAVLNHHREVPYHLLRCEEQLSAGNRESGNLLVQGDNLLALKALLPSHAGAKVIYGEGCRMGKHRLRREKVVFRQIPYEIKVH